MPLGAKTPNQIELSKPWVPAMPLEAMVGTSFTAATGLAVVTPSSRTLPALYCGSTVCTWFMMQQVSPRTTDVMASGPPL